MESQAPVDVFPLRCVSIVGVRRSGRSAAKCPLGALLSTRPEYGSMHVTNGGSNLPQLYNVRSGGSVAGPPQCWWHWEDEEKRAPSPNPSYCLFQQGQSVRDSDDPQVFRCTRRYSKNVWFPERFFEVGTSLQRRLNYSSSTAGYNTGTTRNDSFLIPSKECFEKLLSWLYNVQYMLHD